MARVHASGILLRADTAQGHAKTIAPASYLEKVAAEPWIRTLVPALIIVFLTAIWVGSAVKHSYDRSAAIASAKMDMEHISSLTAIDLQIASDASTGLAPNYALALRMAVPPHGLESGRHAYVTSRDGVIVAAEPQKHIGKSLDQLLGRNQPLTALADRAGVLLITLADGTEALASVRTIEGKHSQLAFVQALTDVLQPWRNRLIAKVILLTSATLAIGLLCVAFLNQLQRTRQTDQICSEVLRRTETALHSGRSGLWDWDVARGRIYWSDSMFQLLGRRRETEFISFGDIERIVHPADVNLFNTANNLMREQDARIDAEFRLRHADGRWVWMRARGEKVTDPTSGALHLVGIAVDITEQKELAFSRATADMRVREAIESISEAFALFDAEKRLVAANSKYQSLLDLPGDALKPGAARGDIEAVSRMSNPPIPVATSDCHENDGCRSYEREFGDGRWYRVNERRTRDGGHVYVSSDITAHKTYEATLANHNEVLENMVEHLEMSRRSLQEKSRRLTELNDLYLLQKAEAEGANRAKAEFLANMNHELRTPLNHIINFAGIMQAEMFGPLGHERYREYAGDVAKSGEYLLGVVSDILDMAGIEAGRVHLERERVALAELCDVARDKHISFAESRGVAMNIRVDGPLHVIGDRRSLQQIIDNMLRNSVKYTRSGSSVGLRAKRHGEMIELFFEDNGVGIADEMIEKMGRPFEQNGSVIENGYKGSGLGYSISKSLAELHGGTIKVRSKIGKGTIVMVTLPVDGPASLVRDREAA